MRLFLSLSCLLTTYTSNAFVQHIPATPRKESFKGIKGSDAALLNTSKLFIPLQMARDDNDKEVNVNLIGDVDSFTLTAVGFGLIAFNFFVLANVSKMTTLEITILHIHASSHKYIFVVLPVNRWETQV